MENRIGNSSNIGKYTMLFQKWWWNMVYRKIWIHNIEKYSEICCKYKKYGVATVAYTTAVAWSLGSMPISDQMFLWYANIWIGVWVFSM